MSELIDRIIDLNINDLDDIASMHSIIYEYLDRFTTLNHYAYNIVTIGKNKINIIINSREITLKYIIINKVLFDFRETMDTGNVLIFTTPDPDFVSDSNMRISNFSVLKTKK